MKLKRMLCCVLSTLFISVPFLTGCSSSQSGNSLFDLSFTLQSEPSAPAPLISQPIPTESSYTFDSSPSPLPSYTPSYPDSGSSITPALWKAENSSGNYVYLMGSIHMGNDSVNHMPAYINSAFEQSDYLAVEADIDSVLQDKEKLTQLTSVLIYSDGTTIKDHVSESTYNGMVDLMQSQNSFQEIYNCYKPFLWQSLLSGVLPSYTDLNTNLGVDMVFLQRAKSINKPILEVENIDFQIDMFNSFSDGLNDALLAEYLKPNYSQAASNYINTVYSMWEQGRVDESMILSGTFIDIQNANPVYVQEYYDKLIKERNINMTKTIEGYIDGGQRVFVLVGAFHYCGDDGINALLTKDGYTVTQVYY